ncbi:MAG TPA: outer membrane beta-barrel protein [Vicinamibacterales bacterium]|nr:outer membrane beta-barrel protein [Vicinamibacterales bacterium]
MALLLALVRATPSWAQGDSSGAGPRQLRVGPLIINPTISLVNIGIDQNVFNDPADQDPKSDFTFTLTPAVDMRLRLFRTVVTADVAEEVVWYQTYSSERSLNPSVRLGWQVPFNRVSFTINGGRASLRDRPGFEIDSRARRTELHYDGRVEVRVLSKTFFGVTAVRQQVAYDPNATFLFTDLAVELNRVTTTGGLAVRQMVTPLTSISLTATRSQDHFEFSSLRDSNSTSLFGTIAFDPFGLIRGSATVGYQDFTLVTPGVPGYQGVTVAVNMSYVARGSTTLTVTGTRDVEYSYDVNQPYYLLSGATVSIRQLLVRQVDGIVRAGAQQLGYRDRAGAVVAVADRVDHVTTYGGGVGYNLGRGTRIGFNVDWQNRISAVDARQFKGLRYGFAVTYGS